ncbi:MULTISPECIES: hypothetical protein [Enterococcus]|uniref:hypothetical protein n=1 Tax=Enterococcus TaxID=1350 RepID=UPI001898981B|nr:MULTISPECIES: hypothetical protein [Enterococcus]MDQ2048247.1 hypothetical protein [Enterococcus faecium]HDP1318803.1 hypothetical protein [Enterococcus faecium]
MKKWLIAFATIFLLVSIVLSIWKPDDAPRWIEAFNTILAAVLAYIQFIYSNSKDFFIFVNKLLAWIKHETVVWTASYKFSFRSNSEYSFGDDVQGFKNRITTKFPEAKVQHLKINDESASFKFNYAGYPREITIHVDHKEADLFQIRLTYECSLSYKDSKKEIDRFSYFLSEISKNHEVIGTDTAEQKSQLEVYSVKISFTKFNPFYRLTVKNVSDVKDIKFNLSFTEGESTIKTNKNTLNVSSRDKNELLSVLENYIALASIG